MVINQQKGKKQQRKNKKRKRLNSVRIVINRLMRHPRLRTRFYDGTGSIKRQNGTIVADMDVILKFFDDGDYIYNEGYGKNYRNTNLTISSSDNLFIEGRIPVLKKNFELNKVIFQDDIILQLPNKIRRNQKTYFTAYDFKFN